MFQHVTATIHKATSMKIWLGEIGVGNLEWPVQRSDLNPNAHLWDKLEH